MLSRTFDRVEIAASYANHPQRADVLLAHVLARRGSLDDLTEADLAWGEGPWSDQNHPGGASSVLDLAARLDIGPGHFVLDIGSGLGGPARLLADLRGCRVVAVELTESRHRDSVLLTERTGLVDRVRSVLGDFLSAELAPNSFDFIVGLACFNHFARPDALLARCASLLKPGGRLAFEDVVLLAPQDPDSAPLLRELAERWTGHFVTAETWRGRLERFGWTGLAVANITAALLQDQEARIAAAKAAGHGAIDPLEVRGWELGRDATLAGLIGYARVIAGRTDSSSTPDSEA